jgi:hypothetical protein
MRVGVLGTIGAVQADDGVEVDGPAPLVFGDFGVRDLKGVAEFRAGEARAGGELLAQVGGEAGP